MEVAIGEEESERRRPAAAAAAGQDDARKEWEKAAEEAVRTGGVVVSASELEVRKDVRIVSSVSEGVRVATSGMTVHVMPGEYRESVVVDKDVLIVGWGCTPAVGNGVEEGALRAKIIGSDAGPALTVKECKATVCGLRLENASTRVNVVEVTGGSGWTIEGCSVSGKSSGSGAYNGGIVIKDGTGIVRSCTVSECGEHGILVAGKSEVVVERCMAVRNKSHGVCAKANVRMAECECSENGVFGLATMGVSNVVAERCQMMRNTVHGVDVDGNSARFTECSSSENGSCGLWIAGQSNVIAEKCKVVHNKKYGMYVKSQARVVECEFVQNGEGGIATDNKSQCTAERCSLINNGGYGAYHRRQLPVDFWSSLALSGCTISGNAKGDRKGC
jgi:hypothetical protein